MLIYRKRKRNVNNSVVTVETNQFCRAQIAVSHRARKGKTYIYIWIFLIAFNEISHAYTHTHTMLLN